MCGDTHMTVHLLPLFASHLSNACSVNSSLCSALANTQHRFPSQQTLSRSRYLCLASKMALAAPANMYWCSKPRLPNLPTHQWQIRPRPPTTPTIQWQSGLTSWSLYKRGHMPKLSISSMVATTRYHIEEKQRTRHTKKEETTPDCLATMPRGPGTTLLHSRERLHIKRESSLSIRRINCR
jgi:hypothetical protein